MGSSIKALEAVIAKAEVLHMIDTFEVQRARQRLGDLRDVERRLVTAAAGCSIEETERAIASAKTIGADESWPAFVDAMEREVVLQDLRTQLHDAMVEDDLLVLARIVAMAEALRTTETIEYRDAKLRLNVLADLRKAKTNWKVMRMTDFGGFGGS
jgi:hypothetical protein